MMRDYLESFDFFSDRNIDDFLNLGIRRKANKKEIMFIEGSSFSKLWFINDGIVRSFRVIDGQDITFAFFGPNCFSVDFTSFLTNKPSMMNFEALTEVDYYDFPKRKIYEGYDKDLIYDRFGRLMAEEAYMMVANRLLQFQSDNLQTRYNKLINQAPELFNQVPLNHIATFLGVKPQSLSRIRAARVSKQSKSQKI